MRSGLNNPWLVILTMALLPTAALAQETPRTAQEMFLQNSQSIDNLWVLVCAGAVFFMQAGFLAFEVGVVRPNAAASVAMKNVIDAVIMMIFYFLVGFGVMYGTSVAGLGVIGSSLFAFDPSALVGTQLVSVFFIFQLAFACTAMTIVSGAMAERTGFIGYVAAAMIVGMVVYPVFGHWAWGNLLISSNESWLAALGFIDFAGSTVVHSVGGWIALVGIWLIGPRLGRFDAETGEPQELEGTPYGIAWTAMGTLFLWVGWWGFNGGSTLKLDTDAVAAIMNTNLSGGAAGLVAFLHCRRFQSSRDMKLKTLGGLLTGLVAITASAPMVPAWSALIIGGIAGLLHNVSTEFMLYRLKLDDGVGAVPVHLVGGVFGTLVLALFVRPEFLVTMDTDSIMMTRLAQLGVQGVGVLACMAWSVVLSYVMFGFLHETFGLRLSPQDELDGISYGERESTAAVSDDEAERIRQMLEG